MSLLKCIAKSLVKNLANLGGRLVGIPVAGDIAVDVWDRWEKEADEQTRKHELQTIAEMQIEKLREEIKAIIGEEAIGLARAQQQALAEYLQQVPSTIRRSLRRSAEPQGATVPNSMRLRNADDLLPLLPPTLPRFSPGDRPWDHSDLQLVAMLGQGGFGEVWKAKHVDRPLTPPVAIKFCTDQQAVHSLVREKDLLDRVSRIGRHDGIVQLLYVHLRNDPPALEYECVEGGELSRLIARMHRDGFPSPDELPESSLPLPAS